MLPAQRRSKMALYIQQTGGTDTETLAKRFGVSVMTARRDLKILEQENHLKLTWGGAVPLTFLPHEIPYSSKVATMLHAKEAIADYAANLISDDSCILLDAGTTALALAKKLTHRRLTVITPDLRIALELASGPHLKVHIPGGEVDPGSRSCNDGATVAFLDTVNVTQAFLGTNVWDVSRGAGTSSHMRMRIKKKMIQRAQQPILLADSSKYNAFGPWVVAQLVEFSCVITDSGLPGAAREAVMQGGADLRVVPAKKQGAKKRKKYENSNHCR